MSKQHWLIGQLSSLSKNVVLAGSHGIVRRVLVYLSSQAYFDNDKEDAVPSAIGARLVHNEKIDYELNETLLGYVGVVLAKRDAESRAILVDTIDSIGEQLSGGGANKRQLNAKLAKRGDEYATMLTRISRLLATIGQHMKTVEKEEVAAAKEKQQPRQLKLNVLETFFIVTSIECFRMFDTLKSSQQVIDDIDACLQRFVQHTSSSQAEKQKKQPKSKEHSKQHFSFFLTKSSFIYFTLILKLEWKITPTATRLITIIIITSAPRVRTSMTRRPPSTSG